MARTFRTDVVIQSSAAGTSGLTLANLPAGTAQTTYNGILAIDANGVVVKVDATKISSVTVGAVAPTSPTSGQQWLDTSVTPSELRVYNGTMWVAANDEVQHFANLAAFPATGVEGVLYVDDATDIAYVWDATSSTYKNASGTGAGLFSIADGTTTEVVGVSDTVTFTEDASIADVLDLTVAATDTVKVGAKAGHTIGQAMVSDGTKFVYANVGVKYATTITPVANVAQTVTHNLGSTDVIVNVYDATTSAQVFVDVATTGINTISVTSTTADNLRIVVLG